MPKAAAERREIVFLLRLSKEERRLLDTAAKLEGLPTGSWLRTVGIQKARTVIAKARKVAKK